MMGMMQSFLNTQNAMLKSILEQSKMNVEMMEQ
jgi:hypothetical protein